MTSHKHTHTHTQTEERGRQRETKNSAQAPLHFGLTIKLMELDVVHRKLQVKGSIKYSRCKLMSLIKKYIQNLKLLYCSQSSIVSSSIHRVLFCLFLFFLLILFNSLPTFFNSGRTRLGLSKFPNRGNLTLSN